MLVTIAGNKKPKIAKRVFVARSADVIGDVTVGEGSSLWYQTVLRGDVMPIVIGKDTNIQDQACIHGTLNKAKAVIGDGVTVGHRALLHGCRVEDFCLIGMGAILMDNCVIGHHSVVGAGSIVTGDKVFEPYSLIMGSPAKFKRRLTEKEIEFLSQSAENYKNYQTWYEQIIEE